MAEFIGSSSFHLIFSYTSRIGRLVGIKIKVIWEIRSLRFIFIVEHLGRRLSYLAMLRIETFLISWSLS